MEHAFKAGGKDPTLEMVIGRENKRSELEHWVPREEQEKVDAIVNGSDQGKYYLLIGETGTGKSSMLVDAMLKVDGEGVSVFEGIQTQFHCVQLGGTSSIVWISTCGSGYGDATALLLL